MPRKIPPFGGADDADIENALQWFLGFLNADDWKTRVAAIERNIETAMQPRTRAFHAEDYVSAYGGRDRMATALPAATVDGKTMTLTFGHPLKADSAPAGSAFAVYAEHGGGPGIRRCWGSCQVQVVGRASISGATATLTLEEMVPKGATVTFDYRQPGTNPLRLDSGVPVRSFNDRPATVVTTTELPFSPYAAVVYQWDKVWMVFNTALDGSPKPAPSAFEVMATPRNGGRARSVAVTDVRDWEGSLLLVMERIASQGETLAVSYTKPSVNPLRNRAGAEMDSFRDLPVAHGPPKVKAVAVSSDAGGRPHLRAGRDHAGAGDVRDSGERADERRQAAAEARPGPGIMGREVGGLRERWRDGHADLRLHRGGVGRLDLGHRGVREQARTQRRPDPFPVGVPRYDADLAHAGLDHDPGHKVDVTLPVFQSAAVEWKTLAMTFDRALDTGSAPAPGDFHVTANGARRNVASGGVAISGRTVTLTLASEVLDTDTVKVRYTRPTANPLQSSFGRAVATFADQAVTNNTAEPIWSATLTAIEFNTFFGCAEHLSGYECSSRLTDNSFTIGGTTFQVTRVIVDSSSIFDIGFNRAIPSRDWTLHVGDSELSFADATFTQSGKTASWTNSGITWTNGQSVSLRLTAPVGGSTGSVAGGDSGGGSASATGVSVVSSAGADKTYGLGDTVHVRVTFDETVEVTGSPRLKIDMDPAHWGEKWAAYESGSGTSSLTFAHTLVEPNYSTQGIAVLADSLSLSGGTIRSAATNANAVLGHTGRGHDAGHKVDWRPELSVADAQANEGAGVSIAFEVSLDRAFTTAAHRVTVDYATGDGTAKAGEDYTATSGTLTFAAGEKTKTVSVPILDDAIDEGEETFSFRLSNATGARIGDGEATGTISNDDPLQKMWLSRIGRTVASHVTDAVSDRMASPLTGAQVTVGGQRVDLAQAQDSDAMAQALAGFARALGARDAPGPEDEGAPGGWLGERGAGWNDAAAASAPRRMTGRELLLGSAFHLAREGDGGGPGFAAWGRVTTGGFDGEASADDGSVRIDGDVTTGILGADAEWNRLLAGVAVSLSEGEGTFAHPGVDSGTIESPLTTVSPYARLRFERAGLGLGSGRLRHGRHDHRAGCERPRPVRAGDPEDRHRDAHGRGGRPGGASGGGRDRRHRPRDQGRCVPGGDGVRARLERREDDGAGEPGAARPRREPQLRDGRRRADARPGARASPRRRGRGDRHRR